MKRTGNTKPFLSWALIVRNTEEKLPGAFEKCLKSLRARTPDAEIVIVDTCSGDYPTQAEIESGAYDSGKPKTHQVALKYADVFEVYRGPRNDWDEHMLAFDDAAAARNRSFELASGTWLGWVDADDEIPDRDTAEHLLRINGRWHLDSQKGTEVVSAEQGKPPTLYEIIEFASAQGATSFWAPYLFKKDEAGRALDWLDRERIVRNDGNWIWRSKGHEICVPKDAGFVDKRAYLSDMLWVHNKKWSDSDLIFSTTRHFNALIGGYEDRSDFTTRTCLYLASWAPGICPNREEEFLNSAYEAATQPLDRYRTLIAMAGFQSRRGFVTDAYENIAAAISIYPDLPDAYMAGAAIASACEDWLKAGEWFEKASRIVPGNVLSQTPPRVSSIEAKTNAAYSYWRAGKAIEDNLGKWESALEYYAKAASLSAEVVESETKSNGPDLSEAMKLDRAFSDARDQLNIALSLRSAFDYLIRDDDTIRASRIVDLLPTNYRTHPIAAAMEQRLAKLKTHLIDPKAYADFYADDKATGARASHDEHTLLPMSDQLSRVKYLAEVGKAFGQPIKVLEVGCFDGNIGIPLMKELPTGSKYTGIETQTTAVERFKGRVERWMPDRKADFNIVPGLEAENLAGEGFDLIVFCEVIEHVPDPVASLRRLISKLAPAGKLYVSTPHGAFDRGLPADLNTRDPRGHVRAITLREMNDWAREAGGRIYESQIFSDASGIGAALCCVIERLSVYAASYVPPPVSFIVPGALWRWNATHVKQTGIGASEETIVYMAERLAEMQPAREMSVYGPLPVEGTTTYEEANAGVLYWPHSQYHRIDPHGICVVSRQPSYGVNVIDHVIGRDTRRILWLQDAEYGDLNPEVAARYEKIVVLSEWHKQIMNSRHNVPFDKMEVVPNFFLAEHVRPKDIPTRLPHHFIYASSPDRGLITLLKMWPEVLNRWPDATLDIFYGWDGVRKLASSNPNWAKAYRAMRRAYEPLMYQKGVNDRGRVNHAQIAYEMLRAGVWFYPTHFEETFCLHGDSRISVPGNHRGGAPTIAIKDLAGKINFPVYAYDTLSRQFKIAKALRCWETKVAKELVEIVLDDGKILRCTPDHKILNYDEEWCEAGSLKAGDRLTALHYRYDVMILDGNGQWVKESRLIGEYIKGRELRSDEHVDHMDPERLDNTPERLTVMTAAEHMSKTGKGKTLRKAHVLASRSKFKAWAAANPDKVRERNIKAQRTKTAGMTESEAHAYNQEQAYKAWRTRRERYGESGRKENHKVVEVRHVVGSFPVYDMEVEGVHSFVADGVVVHNCSNAVKARACGCVPVTHPIAALAETANCDQSRLIPKWAEKDGEPFAAYTERCLDAVADAFSITEAERIRMSEEAISEYEIGVISPKWKELLR